MILPGVDMCCDFHRSESVKWYISW